MSNDNVINYRHFFEKRFGKKPGIIDLMKDDREIKRRWIESSDLGQEERLLWDKWASKVFEDFHPYDESLTQLSNVDYSCIKNDSDYWLFLWSARLVAIEATIFKDVNTRSWLSFLYEELSICNDPEELSFIQEQIDRSLGYMVGYVAALLNLGAIEIGDVRRTGQE